MVPVRCSMCGMIRKACVHRARPVPHSGSLGSVVRPLWWITRIASDMSMCCARGVILVGYVLSLIIVVTRAVVTWVVSPLVTLAPAGGVLFPPLSHA